MNPVPPRNTPPPIPRSKRLIRRASCPRSTPFPASTKPFTPKRPKLRGDVSGTPHLGRDRREAVAGAMTGAIAAQRVGAAEQRLLGRGQRGIRCARAVPRSASTGDPPRRRRSRARRAARVRRGPTENVTRSHPSCVKTALRGNDGSMRVSNVTCAPTAEWRAPPASPKSTARAIRPRRRAATEPAHDRAIGLEPNVQPHVRELEVRVDAAVDATGPRPLDSGADVERPFELGGGAPLAAPRQRQRQLTVVARRHR